MKNVGRALVIAALAALAAAGLLVACGNSDATPVTLVACAATRHVA